jgi:hypothetical protein
LTAIKQVSVKQFIANSSQKEAGRLGGREAGKLTKMGGARLQIFPASKLYSILASEL